MTSIRNPKASNPLGPLKALIESDPALSAQVERIVANTDERGRSPQDVIEDTGTEIEAAVRKAFPQDPVSNDGDFFGLAEALLEARGAIIEDEAPEIPDYLPED